MKTAKELIAAKQKTEALPPQELIEQLRELCEYNDSCGAVVAAQRISWRAACEMLQDNGYSCSYEKLQRLCRKALGRKSWAQP